jgi:hypothetical protein
MNCIVCNKANPEYENCRYYICCEHAEISRMIGDSIARRSEMSPPGAAVAGVGGIGRRNSIIR